MAVKPGSAGALFMGWFSAGFFGLGGIAGGIGMMAVSGREPRAHGGRGHLAPCRRPRALSKLTGSRDELLWLPAIHFTLHVVL